MRDLPRDSDGELSAYAWPGGYPIFYIDRESNVLCVECARRDVDDSQAVTDADINWEDPSLYCADCSARIESAYAEDDAPNPS